VSLACSRNSVRLSVGSRADWSLPASRAALVARLSRSPSFGLPAPGFGVSVVLRAFEFGGALGAIFVEEFFLVAALAEVAGGVLTFLEDILIVAPYNLQVNLLKRLLPAGAQIGAVDKFQGQEAAVVIVSMTTSNGGEAPRGTEFLFNPNRFNVAVSRAQCLVLVVHGAELLDGAWTKIDDLRRLNLFAHAESVAHRAT
jgi:AAA domain